MAWGDQNQSRIWPSFVVAFRISIAAGSFCQKSFMTAAMPPTVCSHASCMRRPRSATTRRPVDKSKTPAAVSASRWVVPLMLAASVAALGLSTDPRALRAKGLRPMLLGVGATLFVATVGLLGALLV